MTCAHNILINMHKFDDRPDIEPIWIHMNPYEPTSLSSLATSSPFGSSSFSSLSFKRSGKPRWKPFCVSAIFPAKNLTEVLWWSSRACSARCQANAKASRNCSAKLKRRPEKKSRNKKCTKTTHVGHADVCMTQTKETKNTCKVSIVDSETWKSQETWGRARLALRALGLLRFLLRNMARSWSQNWTKKPPTKTHLEDPLIFTKDHIFWLHLLLKTKAAGKNHHWGSQLPGINFSKIRAWSLKIFDYAVARNWAPKWSDYCNTNDQCCDLEISRNGGPNFEPLLIYIHLSYLPSANNSWILLGRSALREQKSRIWIQDVILRCMTKSYPNQFPCKTI